MENSPLFGGRSFRCQGVCERFNPRTEPLESCSYGRSVLGHGGPQGCKTRMNRAVQCTPIPFRGIGNRWLQEAPHRGANGVHWRVMRPGPGGASRARRMNPVKQEARIATEEAIRMSRETLTRSEEHTSELQSHVNLVCRLLLEKKKKRKHTQNRSGRKIHKRRHY